MLILTRKRGESIYIGGRIKITVVELKGNQVRIGIDAPQTERVYREEIYIQILEENKRAAEAAQDGLEGLSAVWKERSPRNDSSEPLKGNEEGTQLQYQKRLGELTTASVQGENIPVFRKKRKQRVEE